jgi:hypothetical protein
MNEILPQPRKPGRLCFQPVIASAAIAAFLALACPAWAAGDAPSLGLPIDCIPGQTCWISKFVDLDPGPDVRDYSCHGRANNGHSGIDIALRDEQAMADGVAVKAAAAGTVLRSRDGMADISARDLGPNMIEARECGNGVVIDHGHGWITQYCHMHMGSIAVNPGQHVAAGEKLGLVGMSGSSEYPHLHMTVQHNNQVVDPFVGTDGRADGTQCGLGTEPLWNETTLQELAYTPAAIFNTGFATDKPSEEDARKGRYRATDFGRDAPILILWCEIFGVEAGDILHLRMLAPDGSTLVNYETPLKARKARWFQYVGKKRPGFSWPEGTYHAEITLTRSENGATQSTSATLDAHVGAAPSAAPGK